MYISLVRANSGVCDVAILYTGAIVLADAITGVRYVSERAADRMIPFATLSLPSALCSPHVVSRIAGYEHCDLDIYADKFVNRNGTVCAAGFDDPIASLPSTGFWKAVAALYSCELNGQLCEW